MMTEKAKTQVFGIPSEGVHSNHQNASRSNQENTKTTLSKCLPLPCLTDGNALTSPQKVCNIITHVVTGDMFF